ncbi:MAG: hypothetical protein Q7T96_10560 [Methylobacter sp.]|nr:hypothetical protein [Methylobacter sp.]
MIIHYLEPCSAICRRMVEEGCIAQDMGNAGTNGVGFERQHTVPVVSALN